MSTLVFLINITFLLGLSFFFSASETALFSLKWWRIHSLRYRVIPRGKLLSEIMENPRKILIVILICNTCVNIAVSAGVEHRIESLFPEMGLTIAIISMSIILLVFGEITPKILALTNPEKFSLLIVYPLKLVMLLVAPLRWILEHLISFLVPFFTSSASSGTGLKKDDFLLLVDEGKSEQVLTLAEHRIVREILNLENVQVRDVMTPRTQMVALPVDSSIETALDTFIRNDVRRIPLYRESMDRIVGILYAKDTLETKYTSGMKRTIASIARVPLFVPPTLTLKELYDQFARSQSHLAIVLDEYGGTAGLIALEDVLQGIFGFLDPSHLLDENSRHPDSEQIVVNGQAMVKDIYELLNLPPAMHSARTINGYLSEKLERIPQTGETVVTELGSFKIIDASAQKVNKVVFEPAKKGLVQ